MADAVGTPVRVTGFFRGNELDASGSLSVGEREIGLELPGGTFMLPIAGIDGVVWIDADVLAIHLSDGDAIQLSGAMAARDALNALVASTLTVPELTLSLRGLGSRRAAPGGTFDGFFAPMLSARRRAGFSGEIDFFLTALDAAAMRDAMSEQLRNFVSRRYPARASDRRALQAQLDEIAAPLFVALSALKQAQEALAGASDADRLARMRAWSSAMHHAFDAADRCWLAMRPVLESAHRERVPRWRRWLRLGLMLLAVSAADRASAQVVDPATRHRTVRVTGAAADLLRANGFDVVEAHGRDALVVADDAERARLTSLAASRGFAVATLPQPPARANAASGAAAPTVYRPFEGSPRGIGLFLDSMARANPTRVHLDTIGRTLEGRPMIAVKIGAADDSPARPNVLFMATYHAREWASTEIALRLIKLLAQAVPDARVDSLVKRRDIWVIPVANPDGYQYTFSSDRLWRKNRRPNGDGSFGVDLNRNHAERWGFDNIGSSPFAPSEVYRGPSAESEAEVRAIVQFHAAHPMVMSVSYHTYTGVVLFPPGYAHGLLPGDFSIFRALAGTDIHPAVLDRFPGSNRTAYHPAPSWNLYTTNGEYTDWAYLHAGTVAFTVEATSGYENGVYYGFEFPDDEAKLQELFSENLPLALDVLDAAADPLHTHAQATGIASERVTFESVSPVVRVLLPAADAAAATVKIGSATLPMTVDRGNGGVFTVRVVGQPAARPSSVSLSGGVSAALTLLSASGAEQDETAWTATGFRTDTSRVAGALAWVTGSGTLTSPSIQVPSGTDSVSVLYWTRYDGDGFDVRPHGEVQLSTDDGAHWSVVGRVSGSGLKYYPERADFAGVRGARIRVRFVGAWLTTLNVWWIDEITVMAHAAPPALATGVALVPSENPVRGGSVRFDWPFAATPGELDVYDFMGRLVWRSSVAAGAFTVTWNVVASGTRNGVYLAVARGGGRTLTTKLFVARAGST
ncbi:MAG: hypothetical protein M3081_04235 [Gemmatimonadota bacterium]|nr:hypothetical protein [Gemmatimonadota bacterium]